MVVVLGSSSSIASAADLGAPSVWSPSNIGDGIDDVTSSLGVLTLEHRTCVVTMTNDLLHRGTVL